ncbi:MULTISPECIES: nucleotidyltransferase domain-containing protein [unclassified Curtobacterium]|uniref:nucleotidyltransferase domain-containing protein n=1 Tax=unclassified Curtobacterium TaxID=257496 RepID=UPI000D9359A3|nr:MULTISPECIES: XRE family transcriptional regulator [unclassified Curtobacterium]PYY35479.1 DNA-binding protein [Curtobacterium sp. MCBD17_030]PZE38453.1 DNA-binding protein [Curtobacterium sp. MCPF17_031]PZF11476.1 DNA-binding protein [Curtobacterium sp. MCPF17_011]
MRLDHAADLIRLAREDIGMTQTALARAAGMQQPTISAYEAGRKQPRAESFERIMAAAQTRPSIPLTVYADEIRSAASQHRLRDVRVFGSAVRGTDTASSDIDLLVTTEEGADLFDLGGFVSVVEDITGFPVDVLTEEQLDDEHFAHVRDDAVPL